MRIVVIGPLTPDTFADNVADTLARMGHEVLAAGPARRQVSQNRLQNGLEVLSDKLARIDLAQQSHLTRAIYRFDADLVISVDKRLRPPIVNAIRTQAPIVLWFPDAVSSLGRHELFLAPYRRIFLKNPDLVRHLTSVHGLPVAYLPEAANSTWHRPIGTYGTQPYITVAGNLHPTRVRLVERLLEAGVLVKAYGAPMPTWIDSPNVRAIHSGEYITRERKAIVFRESRGVLNNLHPAEYSGSNCRMFEAAASGGVVLNEWRSGMDQLFVRDKEVLSFDSFDELLHRCRRLLADSSFGAPIADAAAARCTREHTYEHRLTRLITDTVD